VVKFISDRIAVMNAGKIVEMGASNAVYENPQDPYTSRLISAIPLGTIDVIKQRQKDRPAA
jgi:peptide/nickel transport system ATP-binding protein